MKLTPMQYAALIMQLATLGQVDLSDNEQDDLEHLEAMLKMALDNVRVYVPQKDIIKARLGGTLLQPHVLKVKKDTNDS